jgi:hypothetical protein
MTKIQELHRKIYDIYERSESGTVTIYKTIKADQPKPVNRFNNLYTGYPINVEIAGNQNSRIVEKNNSILNFTAAMKHKILNTNLKSAVSVGFVAVSLLVLFILSLNISPARGISLAKIFSKAENHKNIHISHYSSVKKEPIQEQWISSSLNFKIYKTGDNLVLWDINNKKMVMKDIGSELYESRPLTKDQITDFKFSIQKSLSSESKYFQPNDELKNITNQNIIENDDGYEITWEEEGYNTSVFNKLKVYTDSKELPFRMECYSKISTDEEYELSTIITFQYLSEVELAVVKDKYF